LLQETFDAYNDRASCAKKVDAHPRGIGGMALHAKKNIVATASDDCVCKVWNLDN